jgi:thiol:disulfide interchange protein
MISRLLLPLLLLASPLARAQGTFDPFNPPAAATAPDADTAPDEAYQNAPVKASLVADQTAVVPGQKFSVAVKLVHEEHWHTFWRNPGQYAQTPSFTWTLPEGAKQEGQLWGIPAVKDSGIENAVQYIYEGTSYVVTEFSTPDSLKTGDKLTLALKAKMQACKEQCIQLDFDLALELPVADKASPSPDAAAFETVRKAQPQATPAWKTSVRPAGEDWIIRAEAGEGAAAEPGKLYFFDAAAATEATPQDWKKDGNAFTATLTGQKTNPPGQQPAGFLTAGKTWTASGVLTAIPVGEAMAVWSAPKPKPETAIPASGTQAISSEEEDKLIAEILSWGVRRLGGEAAKEELKWPLAILFAFLGGMILNLMPCVFPVLGIKILGFVRQAGEDHSIVKKHGLAYAGGVIVSIMVLTAVLVSVRAGSESVGWGFQLQNPWFLTFLIVLVFSFSLSMAGLFEVGTKLTGVGAELQNESGYQGSFFSGLLTVLLATPCTGPFMGPALGFALSAETPYWLVVAIFLALGIGLALPYVILSWFPALVKKLPRPGAWMETFKQFMAFPMFATVVWLLYVFAGTTGRTGVTMMLFALTLLAMVLWLYGRYFQRTAKTRSRSLATATGLLCLLGGGYLAAGAARERAPSSPAGHDGSTPLSAQLIVQRREQGLTTVVDLWAEWCLQCELNRKAAFDRKEFHDALPGFDAIFMLGDKTQEGSPADLIAQKFVKAYKSGGIPYAFIVPPKGPVIELPSVIGSPSVLLEGLVEAEKQSR